MAIALNTRAFQSASPEKPTDKAADWQQLDVATLSRDLQAAYFDYRKAQDAADKLRHAFEAAMSGKVELPSHLKLAFGYKFGRISVAIVPSAGRTSRPAASLESLIASANRA